MNKLEYILVEDIEFYKERTRKYQPNSEQWKRATYMLDGIDIALRKLGYGTIDEFKDKYKDK